MYIIIPLPTDRGSPPPHILSVWSETRYTLHVTMHYIVLNFTLYHCQIYILFDTDILTFS